MKVCVKLGVLCVLDAFACITNSTLSQPHTTGYLKSCITSALAVTFEWVSLAGLT